MKWDKKNVYDKVYKICLKKYFKINESEKLKIQSTDPLLFKILMVMIHHLTIVYTGMEKN